MAKKVKKQPVGGAESAKHKAAAGGSAYVLRARDIGARQEVFSQPWDPDSELIGVRLGKYLGLKRVGVSIVRLPAGANGEAAYAKHREEEWVYVLMGEGLALIGDVEVPVGAGDFLAFPAPQVTHQLKNAGQDDLVYLTGGENAKMDIVDFPSLGKRLVRVGGEITAYPMGAGDILSAGKAKKAKKLKS
jgi:uncharacterized cupin superfamily protein